MRKLTVLALALGAVLVAAPANAALEVNIRQPQAFTEFIPCANNGAGEFVDFTGTLHVLITSTVNDRLVRGKFQVNPQGTSAVGEITGDVYRHSGVFDVHYESVLDAANAFTLISNHHVIGPGSDNNYTVHQVMQVVVNADGTMTVEFNKVIVDCD